MHDVKDFLKYYNIKPMSYLKDKSSYIVSDKNSTYVLNKNKIDNQIYNILRARQCNFIPEVINSLDDSYCISKYYFNYELPDSEKAKDIITLISLLHTKTTHYEKTDISFYKDIYEDIALRIDDLDSYFNNLNELILEDMYMSPSMYLLARNISKVYSLIDFLTNELDEWYTLVSNKDKKRVCVIHNNLSLDNYIKSDNGYLISWHKSCIDMPFKDLEIFYRNSYDKVEFNELFDMYLSKYPFYEDELKLFFISISIPKRLDFKNDEYLNVLEVEKFYDYLYKTDKLLLKYYSQKKDRED